MLTDGPELRADLYPVPGEVWYTGRDVGGVVDTPEPVPGSKARKAESATPLAASHVEPSESPREHRNRPRDPEGRPLWPVPSLSAGSEVENAESATPLAPSPRLGRPPVPRSYLCGCGGPRFPEELGRYGCPTCKGGPAELVPVTRPGLRTETHLAIPLWSWRNRRGRWGLVNTAPEAPGALRDGWPEGALRYA